ncbi:MAG: HAD-IA family hydrolase, partial [Treponema sp.]|nr:HAD-IA family hydrolase [Treponema sp.]
GLPQEITALIFDMDLTLYTSQEYARFQIDRILRQAAAFKGKTAEELEEDIALYRKEWAASHNGKGTSLGNVLAAMGISLDQSIRWREELLEPGDFLGEDPKLKETLNILKADYALALVTNNPVLVARKTLRALGAEEFFPVIVGMDTCGVSKPHRAPYLKAAELLGLDPRGCVSIGDRYEIDIELPQEMGMGGVLVGGVEDVYRLPPPLRALFRKFPVVI